MCQWQQWLVDQAGSPSCRPSRFLCSRYLVNHLSLALIYHRAWSGEINCMWFPSMLWSETHILHQIVRIFHQHQIISSATISAFLVLLSVWSQDNISYVQGLKLLLKSCFWIMARVSILVTTRAVSSQVPQTTKPISVRPNARVNRLLKPIALLSFTGSCCPVAIVL